MINKFMICKTSSNQILRNLAKRYGFEGHGSENFEIFSRLNIVIEASITFWRDIIFPKPILSVSPIHEIWLWDVLSSVE